MKKTISIFGSTGSIGKNTIEVLQNSINSYKIIALVASDDVKTLIKQAKLLKPQFVIIKNELHFQKLQESLREFPEIEVLVGSENIRKIAKIKCDINIMAISGFAALKPTINAIRSGSDIGLANKECLVSAGDLILNEAKKSGSKIIPIDSEHNAIFQVFENDNLDLIEDITLTASGGPFFRKSLDELANITKKQALNHPKWSMGAKISIDSATMMNKALEVIEAYRLFDIKTEQIKVIIHPESIIHGLVNYKDGSTLAMMSLPDMKVPISYAISHPKRTKINHQKLDLTQISTLNFYEADEKRFIALRLARDVLKTGGNAPCILNAANEIAVSKFLNDEISFNDILKINMEVLNKVPYHNISSLEEVFESDKKARQVAKNII